MKKILSGIAACALLSSAAFAQNEVEITTEDLGHGIHAIFGRGGTIGVSVGEDGVFQIDDQLAPHSGAIAEAIEGLGGGSVDYVLNTHWHGDHTGGNEHFGDQGALLVAHENVRSRMASGEDESFFGRSVEPTSPGALPRLTISDRATLYFNDLEVRIIHTPHAHTDGDTIVVFEGANVIHMGDIFFTGNYPFIDVVSGGHLDGNIAALALGLALADDETQIISGHGSVGTKADMQAAHDMLVDVRARVAPLIEGRTEDEVVALDPLTELNPVWGTWFIDGDTMVRFAYRSISNPIEEL